MNRDDIIRMAREAGIGLVEGASLVYFHMSDLECFTKLVAAAEREACADRAGVALLGADRDLANRVDYAIRERGAP